MIPTVMELFIKYIFSLKVKAFYKGFKRLKSITINCQDLLNKSQQFEQSDILKLMVQQLYVFFFFFFNKIFISNTDTLIFKSHI